MARSTQPPGGVASRPVDVGLEQPFGKDDVTEADLSPSLATEPPWPAPAEALGAASPRAEMALDRTRVRQLTLAAFVVLAALNVADVLTTRMVLAHHVASEANPLAGALLGNGTILWVKLFCVLALALSTLKRSRPRVGMLLGAWVAVGLYAAAVLSNVLILRLLSGG
jgi:hypothetical protein